MNKERLFNFKTNLSGIDIPLSLNNPFEVSIPKIAQTAAEEFQAFIKTESAQWDYDFAVRNGKMFGVLVVATEERTLGYLGAISGKISRQSVCRQFVPSVFDDTTGNYFIDRGMTELSAMIAQQRSSSNLREIEALKEKSKQKSIELQRRLFENYHFSDLDGNEKNLLEIFWDANQGKPPAAAGECTAPKLLQYAFSNKLKPIAIAEFWWGNPIKENGKIHTHFYPACNDRCRPILEYMLGDAELYSSHKTSIERQ